MIISRYQTIETFAERRECGDVILPFQTGGHQAVLPCLGSRSRGSALSIYIHLIIISCTEEHHFCQGEDASVASLMEEQSSTQSSSFQRQCPSALPST